MSNQEKHWEKSRGLLMITLAIWFIFSIGIFLFGAEMNEVTGPFGYPVSYTHLRAHETGRNLVCRLLLEKKFCKKRLIN